MLKKSKIYLILLVILFSAFPAAKAIFPGVNGNSGYPAVQTSGQNSAVSSGGVSVSSQKKIMTVHFLDVGQADSVFIDFGTYEILVDGGNNGDGQRITDYMKPYVDGKLELVVATHAHEDHIGGLDGVIFSYQIGEIIYSDEVSATETWQDFYDAADAEPDCVLTGDSDMTFDLGGGAQFKVLDMGDGYREPNNNSVVTMIDYNNVEALLMGDLESSVEKKNLLKFTDADVLKVGHHGSKTATSQAFLDIVKPEASVISAGLDNKYSLPSEEVIRRLLAMNSAVYGTFRSGDITMTTDGVQYTFDTDVQLTLNDTGAPSSTQN